MLEKVPWREPTNRSHRSKSVHSLQILQDSRFLLFEVCVAKSGLHVKNTKNTPEGCILQRFSSQRFTKISTVSLGRNLQDPVPMFRLPAP